MPFEFQHTRGLRCSQHSPQPNFDVDKIYSLQINIDDVIFRSLQGEDWDTICRTVDIGHNWFQCPGCVRASRAWQSAVEDYCCRNHIHLTCEERQLLSYTDTPMMNVLKVGIPKGTLQDSTLKFFKKAGYTINIGSRSYYPSIDDDEIETMLLRPQDMALYVERGVIDMGLAGSDWVRECKADVLEVGALTYSKQTNRPARWVLAVAEDSPIKSVADLEGKIVFTELVEATKSYLVDNGVNATVKFSHGATEVKIPHLCDAIVEITETGSSLRANRLRIVDVVLQSVTTLVVNKESWANEWKRTKIENLYLLLSGALAAEEKVGLKMNISDENLKSVLAILPAMKKPTISSLSEDGWRAVETIIDEHIVRDLIPELKRVGAEGIIEYPLNKVIP